MKVRDIFEKDIITPSQVTKEIDFSKWSPRFTDATITRDKDSDMNVIRFKVDGMPQAIDQQSGEDMDAFRQRVKTEMKRSLERAASFQGGHPGREKQERAAAAQQGMRSKYSSDDDFEDSGDEEQKQPEIAEEDRLYLNIPFHEKDTAKKRFPIQWNDLLRQWWMPLNELTPEIYQRLQDFGWLDE